MVDFIGPPDGGAAGRRRYGPAPLYQVAGGEQEITIEKPTSVDRLALEKGVRWVAVVRQNCLKKPYKLKPGMVLKINNTHIVPDGAAKRPGHQSAGTASLLFPERGLSAALCPGRGQAQLAHPHRDLQDLRKAQEPHLERAAVHPGGDGRKGSGSGDEGPPGPKNPLGKFWLGTTASGVGIHATNRPWSVGYFVSHGCIRMLPNEIEQLFPQVEVGTPVKIIYRPIKLALTPQGRVYLEAIPNIYGWELNPLEWVKDMAEYYNIADRIDWDKVPPILKAR